MMMQSLQDTIYTHHHVPVTCDCRRQVLLCALRMDPGHFVNFCIFPQSLNLQAKRRVGVMSLSL